MAGRNKLGRDCRCVRHPNVWVLAHCRQGFIDANSDGLNPVVYDSDDRIPVVIADGTNEHNFVITWGKL